MENEEDKLKNGTAFLLSDKELLVLNVIADKMIVIVPKDINQMGILAHMLGNLHKPVRIAKGEISLLYDKVVAQTLDSKNIPYETRDIQLSEPLHYADLSF